MARNGFCCDWTMRFWEGVYRAAIPRHRASLVGQFASSVEEQQVDGTRQTLVAIELCKSNERRYEVSGSRSSGNFRCPRCFAWRRHSRILVSVHLSYHNLLLHKIRYEADSRACMTTWHGSVFHVNWCEYACFQGVAFSSTLTLRLASGQPFGAGL